MQGSRWRFRRRGRCDMSKLFAAIAIAATLVGTARAQTYPSRPITIVVPFPAGGPTDALARVLAERMKGALGQSVIVENPTGAAGTIGTGRVARAAPDGYTVILGHWQTHVVNGDRKSTRLNSSHVAISYAVFCLTKKKA